MKKLGEQWAEKGTDGIMHMYKSIGLNDDMSEIIKDLGILKDGLLPCPFCGEYPEVDRISLCITCRREKHNVWVGWFTTIQEAIDAWNRRV